MNHTHSHSRVHRYSVDRTITFANGAPEHDSLRLLYARAFACVVHGIPESPNPRGHGTYVLKYVLFV